MTRAEAEGRLNAVRIELERMVTLRFHSGFDRAEEQRWSSLAAHESELLALLG
jgi:hypothetical protein